MRPFRSLLAVFVLLAPLVLGAQDAAATKAAAEANQAALNTQTAGIVGAGELPPTPPALDLLEHLVDVVLDGFNITAAENENTSIHYIVACVFLFAGLVLRRILTRVVFSFLRKLASRTTTTLDDRLFTALEPPAATFVMLVGIFAGLKVLKLTGTLDTAVAYGATVAFSLVLFWGFTRALSALFDHIHQIAIHRGSGVAAFMPWIKKTLITIFVIFGVLLVAQSLGADVKAALTGLGIGGLAFALAAQDTIANVFGSIVVAIDQPFRAGETITIVGKTGTVEDIGLRSTRIRLVDKSLLIVPNKTVAAEAIANNSRFTGRRVEHVIGLTYDTTPAQMEEIVGEIRRIITNEQGVKADGLHVYFRDFSASSLDLWVVYEFASPDFGASMKARQNINLAIMRAVESRGLSFAFPTQTVHLAPSAPDPGAAPAKAPGPQGKQV